MRARRQWGRVFAVAGLMLFAVDRAEVRGPVNATAPAPVRNAEFTRELASVLRRPALFPVPVIALRVLFGEMADVLVGSQRVVPRVAEDAGYEFRFPELQAALADAVVASPVRLS